ncbi:CDP-glycerol glycerophosphotransferase family protein [Polaribacter haliotis]|uniref:CDP-glycerol glycerophosphotransferase family protein n=1 Tax=Polaribacter haliotis TaxID=1888915 RepID=A0A7L8AHN9_9FLAO|nr:CDP-glycerol glycerophosphotransferase family protein [Polaribacter haliotis]QOD61510.1 CDP-glycerol glycerophosphotransferase family protein [Polaribacter haliotis]
MKKLIIILPRGESIKNFVYSGITDALREEYKIIFFSVVPNEEIKKYLVAKCDEFYELEEEHQQNKYANELLKILQIAHLNKLNSVTGNLKIVKDDLLSKKSINANIVRKLRKLIASFYKSESSLVKLTERFERANFKNPKVLELENVLLEIEPDLVFNTSHIHNLISLNLMYAVKKLKIKTATFLFSWDNLTSQGRIIPTYDVYFTWNDKIKRDLLKIYPTVKEENVFVTGTPQFDFHFNEKFIDSKEELYRFLKIPLEKKIILYSTGMAFYTPKEHIIVEEIEKVLRKIDDNLQLVVRIYAKDDNTAYYKLRDSNLNICVPDHFWELNHLTPTLKDISLFNSLLNHCSIGINVASTVSLDLAVLNKPVINIAFNPPNENIYPNDYEKIYEFDHYKPIVKSGAISLVRNTEELEKQIINYLNDSSYLEKERKDLVNSFFGNELKKDKKLTFVSIFNSLLK